MMTFTFLLDDSFLPLIIGFHTPCGYAETLFHFRLGENGLAAFLVKDFEE